MPEQILQRAYGECIDLAEAKLHLRITESSQDAKVLRAMRGARRAAETITRRSMLHTRWKLTLDRFPGYGCGPGLVEVSNIPENAIRLPHSPLVDVVSIEYLDGNGVLQLVPPSTYAVNNANAPGIVTPVFGQIWPIPLVQIASVFITYDAGYASPFIANFNAGTLRVRGPVTWQVGQQVELYNSGGALPAGLLEENPYLVATAANGVYTLTELEGTPVQFADNGSGTNYLGVVPDDLITWILIRTGSVYMNREEVAILNRGSIGELPYIAGLLDPYRTALP